MRNKGLLPILLIASLIITSCATPKEEKYELEVSGTEGIRKVKAGEVAAVLADIHKNITLTGENTRDNRSLLFDFVRNWADRYQDKTVSCGEVVSHEGEEGKYSCKTLGGNELK